MPHYGGGGGWLPLLCWCFFLDALTRPRQPQVVYVQRTGAARRATSCRSWRAPRCSATPDRRSLCEYASSSPLNDS